MLRQITLVIMIGIVMFAIYSLVLDNINVPQLGETWVMKSSNPFQKPAEVKILDQKQGWVLYTSVATGEEYSLSIKDFKTIYAEPVPRNNN